MYITIIDEEKEKAMQERITQKEKEEKREEGLWAEPSDS